MNSLFGWQNSPTYGSVISYNLYWLVVILGFLALRYKETKGHWPLMRAKSDSSHAQAYHEEHGDVVLEKGQAEKKVGVAETDGNSSNGKS